MAVGDMVIMPVHRTLRLAPACEVMCWVVMQVLQAGESGTTAYLHQHLEHVRVAEADRKMQGRKRKEAAAVDVAVVALAVCDRRVAQRYKVPIVRPHDDAGAEQRAAAGGRAGEDGVVEAVFGVQVVEEKGVGAMGEEIGNDVGVSVFACKHCVDDGDAFGSFLQDHVLSGVWPAAFLWLRMDANVLCDLRAVLLCAARRWATRTMRSTDSSGPNAVVERVYRHTLSATYLQQSAGEKRHRQGDAKTRGRGLAPAAGMARGDARRRDIFTYKRCACVEQAYAR